MNILFILNDASGGASQSGYQLITALKQRGHKVYAVCHSWGSDEDARRFQERCDDFRQFYIPWWNIPHESGYLKAWFIFLKRLLQTLFFLLPVYKIVRLIRAWNIDLVHTNTSVQIQGALAARISGRKHIWHIREINDRDGHSFPFHTLIFPGLLYTLSQRIIAISAASAAPLAQHKQAAKLSILHNAIPTAAFGSANAITAAQKLRLSLGIQAGQVVVAMVGNPSTAWKKHEVFIEACAAIASHDQIIPVIFGQIPAEKSAGYDRYLALQAIAGCNGLGKKLIFGGFVSDIPVMMNAIDLLVHPVHNEPFGRVMIEAMAASKPVVAFRSGGAAEIVVHEQSGLLGDEINAQSLGEKIKILCHDAALRQQMGLAAQKHCAKNFDLDTYIQKLEKIYTAI